MRTLVIVFNDANLLDTTLVSLTNPASPDASAEPTAWHLVYAAPNRPARLKRWVSRSGWDRLTVERGRKLALASITRLEASSAAPVQMHGFVGDVWHQSVSLGRSLQALRWRALHRAHLNGQLHRVASSQQRSLQALAVGGLVQAFVGHAQLPKFASLCHKF